MQDVLSALRSMSPAQLNDAVTKARAFMNTPDGKATLERLKKGQPVQGLSMTNEEQNKLVAQLSQDPKIARQMAEIFKK